MEAFASVRRGAISIKPGSDDPVIVYVPIAYNRCFQQYTLQSTHNLNSGLIPVYDLILVYYQMLLYMQTVLVSHALLRTNSDSKLPSLCKYSKDTEIILSVGIRL